MEKEECIAGQDGISSFRSLLEAQAGKMEIIVTFLAILELMKTGKLQEHNLDDILIQSRYQA